MRYQQILRIWAEGRHDPAHMTLTDMASWSDQTKSFAVNMSGQAIESCPSTSIDGVDKTDASGAVNHDVAIHFRSFDLDFLLPIQAIILLHSSFVSKAIRFCCSFTRSPYPVHSSTLSTPTALLYGPVTINHPSLRALPPFPLFFGSIPTTNAVLANVAHSPVSSINNFLSHPPDAEAFRRADHTLTGSRAAGFRIFA